MTITCFTAHMHRPEAWELCEKYLGRQTRAPDQWLCLDSSPEPIVPTLPCDYHHVPELVSMPAKVLYAIENKLIKGDAVIWLENDDWYKDTFVEWCETKLQKYQLVGEGRSVFFNCRNRWFTRCENKHHASLCQTAMHRDLLEESENIIRSYDNPFWDTRLWSLDCNKFISLPEDKDRRVVGMKSVGSTVGYSAEHRDVIPPTAIADPSLFGLFKLIGPDAANYSRFRRTP